MFDEPGILSVTGAAALRTGQYHIGQKLYVEADGTRPVARGTAQTTGIIGKIFGLIPAALRIRRLGIDFPQFVVYIRIGGHGGTDIHSDWRGINQLDMSDTLRLHSPHMSRQPRPACKGLQGGDKAFEYQRRLAGTGNARHHS